MPAPSRFAILRSSPELSQVQDSINSTLRPIAQAVNATPIGGAAPPPWQGFDLFGVTANGSSLPVASYHKDALGYVHIKGDVTNATGGVIAANTTLMVLPIGYRPKESRYFQATLNYNSAITVLVGLDGSIQNMTALAAGNNLSINLDFLAEQ